MLFRGDDMLLVEIRWRQGALGIDFLAFFVLFSWFWIPFCLNSHEGEKGKKEVLGKCVSLSTAAGTVQI